MYKKLAVLFGVLAITIIIVSAVVAYDWLTDPNEAPERQDLENVTRITWGYTPGDLPSGLPNAPLEENSNTEVYDQDTNDDTADDIAEDIINLEDMAPDFTMYDAYGNEVRLSDFFGKPIVLNFWATWCPSCVQEMPYFEEFYAEAGSDVHVLKVNLLDGNRETRERVDNFMTDGGYSFPLFLDSGSGSIEYAVRFIPMTFFIDSQGRLVSSIQGMATLDALRQGVEAAS